MDRFDLISPWLFLRLAEFEVHQTTFEASIRMHAIKIDSNKRVLTILLRIIKKTWWRLISPLQISGNRRDSSADIRSCVKRLWAAASSRPEDKIQRNAENFQRVQSLPSALVPSTRRARNSWWWCFVSSAISTTIIFRSTSLSLDFFSFYPFHHIVHIWNTMADAKKNQWRHLREVSKLFPIGLFILIFIFRWKINPFQRWIWVSEFDDGIVIEPMK